MQPEPIKVLLLAASFATTQGHQAIYSALKDRLLQPGDGAPVILYPVFSSSDYVADRAIAFKPHIVIVDFPWNTSRYVIDRLQRDLVGAERPLWVVVDMHALRDAVVLEGVFDISLEAEPGACTWQAKEKISCHALLNDDGRFATPTEADLAVWADWRSARGAPNSESVFVIQTGSASEREAMYRAAARIYPAPKYQIIGSLDLPQPSVRFAQLADHVFAASGYSTTWELYCLGQIRKTHFIHLYRPVEDVEKRVQFVKELTYSPGAALRVINGAQMIRHRLMQSLMRHRRPQQEQENG